MMEIGPFYILRVLSLVLAACFCLSHGLMTLNATGRCEPGDCSQPPRTSGDNSFPCKIGLKNDCDGFNLKPAGSPLQNVIPPMIFAVNVYQRFYPQYNDSYPVLNVTLSLPGDDYSLNRTKAVKLHIDIIGQSNYSFCRLFDFRNATFTKKDVADPRLLFYPCFCGLATTVTGTFLLTVTALPDNVEVEYYVTVPFKIQPDKRRSPLVMWQPVEKLEVSVMFERLPEVNQYKVILYRYGRNEAYCHEEKDAEVLQSEMVDKDSSNIVTFKGDEDHNFFVKVVPQNCAVCEEMMTHCMALKGVSSGPGRMPSVSTLIPTTVGESPIITHVGSQHNDKATKTILGVVCGVVAGALLVVFLAYLYTRTKRCMWGCSCPSVDAGQPVVMKEEPTVLILYSSDCTEHKAVVERLAHLLIKTFDCHVYFDLLDLVNIQQKGLLNWLHEKINVSNFIIFVCSTGGRLQCNLSNRRMQLIDDHPVEKYFCTAVEEVTNTSREWKIKKENIAVVTMGYSTSGDIPSKLDSFRKFFIRNRQDLVPLYNYLRHTDRMPYDLQYSDEVELFFRVLQDATTFFQENPGWVNKLLDKNYSDSKTPASGKRGKKSVNCARPNNADVTCRQYVAGPVDCRMTSRCYSQPSIHSSEGSFCKYTAMPSRSLVCLNKSPAGEDIELDTVHTSLLGKSRPHNLICPGSDDSDVDDSSPKSMSMPVDIHCTVQGSSSESPVTNEFTSDSDEFDSVEKEVEHVHKGLNSEEIRKVVNPSSYIQHPPPTPPWPPITNHTNPISMVLCPPNQTRKSDHCVKIYMPKDPDMSDC